jgi:hypothetical protein
MSVNEQDFLTDASTSLKQFENKYLSTEIDTTVVNLTENLDSLNSFVDSVSDSYTDGIRSNLFFCREENSVK